MAGARAPAAAAAATAEVDDEGVLRKRRLARIVCKRLEAGVAGMSQLGVVSSLMAGAKGLVVPPAASCFSSASMDLRRRSCAEKERRGRGSRTRA